MKELISELAYQDMAQSRLEESFAGLWADWYPSLDLMTQCPFVPNRKFRVDFAYGQNIQFQGKKPKLLLPPGVLIDIHGGVHCIKFEKDEEKAIAAVKLGFKFHRLSEGMLCREFLDAIAQDILSLQNNVSDQT